MPIPRWVHNRVLVPGFSLAPALFKRHGYCLFQLRICHYSFESRKTAQPCNGSVGHLLLGDHAKVHGQIVSQEIVHARPVSLAMADRRASLVCGPDNPQGVVQSVLIPINLMANSWFGSRTPTRKSLTPPHT